MFERFTTQARATVALAVEEARAAGHTAVGTEHILLGLLHARDTVAARALFSLDVDLTKARLLVVRTLGSGEPPDGQIPFTPAAERALRLALPEAVSRGRSDVEPEDILLALVAEPAAGAAQILLELDATPDDVRRKLHTLGADPVDSRRALPDWFGLEEPVTEGELEVGWRGRGIALAAAVLGRSAFAVSRTGPLNGLEVDSLPGALACDHEELSLAINALRREQLVVRPDEVDDHERVAITPAGLARVQHWLARIVSLFGGWPPDHPGVDDATA